VSGSVSANGDELIINNGVAERIFPVTITPSYFNTIFIKAHGQNVGDSLIYTIYNSTGGILYGPTYIYPQPQYSVFQLSVSISGTPYKYRFQSTQNVAVDFVAFVDSSNVLTYEGSVIEMNVDKKTIQQKIPFYSDVIQTLGIATTKYSVSFMKIPKSAYDWFETRMVNGQGVLCLTPSYDFTGLVSSVEGTREPGTTLYDVSVEILKGDSETF
jgi:hypothetical protein